MITERSWSFYPSSVQRISETFRPKQRHAGVQLGIDSRDVLLSLIFEVEPLDRLLGERMNQISTIFSSVERRFRVVDSLRSFD